MDEFILFLEEVKPKISFASSSDELLGTLILTPEMPEAPLDPSPIFNMSMRFDCPEGKLDIFIRINSEEFKYDIGAIGEFYAELPIE